MPKYHVNLYALVRVRVPDVEADSQEEACQTAEQRVNLDSLFHGVSGPYVSDVEYADEVNHYLVDLDGDEEYKQSQFFDGDKIRPVFPERVKEGELRCDLGGMQPDS